eukprot:2280711-Prymnesium_polylepis.2
MRCGRGRGADGPDARPRTGGVCARKKRVPVVPRCFGLNGAGDATVLVALRRLGTAFRTEKSEIFRAVRAKGGRHRTGGSSRILGGGSLSQF